MNIMKMRHRFMFLFLRNVKLRTHASLPWPRPFAYGGPKTSTLTSRVRSAARHRFCPTLRACASGQRTSYLEVSSPATGSERRLSTQLVASLRRAVCLDPKTTRLELRVSRRHCSHELPGAPYEPAPQVPKPSSDHCSLSRPCRPRAPRLGPPSPLEYHRARQQPRPASPRLS